MSLYRGSRWSGYCHICAVNKAVTECLQLPTMLSIKRYPLVTLLSHLYCQQSDEWLPTIAYHAVNKAIHADHVSTAFVLPTSMHCSVQVGPRICWKVPCCTAWCTQLSLPSTGGIHQSGSWAFAHCVEVMAWRSLEDCWGEGWAPLALPHCLGTTRRLGLGALLAFWVHFVPRCPSWPCSLTMDFSTWRHMNLYEDVPSAQQLACWWSPCQL